jgi:hypothetical protein
VISRQISFRSLFGRKSSKNFIYRADFHVPESAAAKAPRLDCSADGLHKRAPSGLSKPLLGD